MKNFNKITLNIDSTILQAMKKINLNSLGCVFVEDNNKILGVLTDGDLRRAIIKKNKTNENIKKYVNYDFYKLYEGYQNENILKIFDLGIRIVPILNNKNQLVNFINRKDFFKYEFLKDQLKDVQIRSRAPSRISFGGGGSDVTSYYKDNEACIFNTSINLYCNVFLEIKASKKIIIDSQDLEKVYEFSSFSKLVNDDSESLALIRNIIKEVKPDYGFNMTIRSDFPIGSGLGGSSTVVVAILGAFNEIRANKWSKYEVAELAFKIERLVMNIKGGWQDQYASSIGGFNFMTFRSDKNTVDCLRFDENTVADLNDSMILCNSGMDHKSNDLHVELKEESKNETTINKIKENVELTKKAKNALTEYKIEEFGRILNEAWLLKKKFSKSVTNKSLDKIYNIGMDAGAYGAKLLGAGGGGFFLFVVPPLKRKLIESALKKHNLEVCNFSFDNKGLVTWRRRINE